MALSQRLASGGLRPGLGPGSRLSGWMSTWAMSATDSPRPRGLTERCGETETLLFVPAEPNLTFRRTETIVDMYVKVVQCETGQGSGL